MKQPSNRTFEDVQILIRGTSFLDFFAKINSKQVNVTRRIHEKCIKNIHGLSKQRGDIVINYSIIGVLINR